MKLSLQKLEQIHFRAENQRFTSGDISEEMVTTCAFSHCLFENVSWSKSALQNVQFLSCNLRENNFNETSLSGVNLVFGQVDNTNMDNSELIGCHFTNTKMFRMSFKNTKFINCSMPESELINCDFRGADLTGLDLSKVTSLGGCLFNHKTKFGSKKHELLSKGLISRNLEIARVPEPEVLAPVIDIKKYLKQENGPKKELSEDAKIIVLSFEGPSGPEAA